MGRVARSSLLLVVFALAVGGGSGARAQTGASATVDLVEVDGLIDRTVADYVRDRIAGAQADGVHALVLQLDTPGGLDVPTREIVQEMLASEVPVVVWIAPRGARAASAGTFITLASDLAFMAEATELGAATPLDLSTGDVAGQKVVNDAAAFLRDLATAKGRDPEFAEAAVLDAASLGSADAIERGVVDGAASSLGDLLRAMDERVVEREAGDLTLETWDEGAGAPSVTVRFQEMNLWDRLLHSVTGAEVAFALLLIGMFGLIFELYNPGIGLAGILGAACLALGFYALSVLPTNWLGVVLVVASTILLLIDLHTAGFGAWTFAGIGTLVGGGVLMFAGAAEPLRLEPWAIVVAVVGTLLFFVSVMTAALRVRLRRPVVGEEGIVGAVGEARTDIAPEGTVFTKGALWRARTMETGIAAGSKVEIKATEGLVLLVEPLHDSE